MKAIGYVNLKKLEKIENKLKLDAIILVSKSELIDPNIQYYTNFVQEEGLGDCIVVIRNCERTVFLKEEPEQKIDAEEIIISSKFKEAFKKEFKNLKNVGINSSYLKYSAAMFLRKKLKLKLLDVSPELLEIRAIKLKKEIQIFKKAFKFTNSLIDFIESYIIPKILEGISERQIALMIEDWCKKRNLETSFKTLVGTGKRSAQIHTNPSSSLKKAGKIGYIDFGVKYKGYHTDVTLPFALRKLNRKEEKIVETLISAYQEILDRIKVGIYDFEIFETANNYLRKFGLEMKHGVGHGIGLEVHEFPSFLPKKGRRKIMKISNGMVFTIEPGIYLKNFGFRIEDDFLVKKNKIIPMTNSHFIFR